MQGHVIYSNEYITVIENSINAILNWFRVEVEIKNFGFVRLNLQFTLAAEKSNVYFECHQTNKTKPGVWYFAQNQNWQFRFYKEDYGDQIGKYLGMSIDSIEKAEAFISYLREHKFLLEDRFNELMQEINTFKENARNKELEYVTAQPKIELNDKANEETKKTKKKKSNGDNFNNNNNSIKQSKIDFVCLKNEQINFSMNVNSNVLEVNENFKGNEKFAIYPRNDKEGEQITKLLVDLAGKKDRVYQDISFYRYTVTIQADSAIELLKKMEIACDRLIANGFLLPWHRDQFLSYFNEYSFIKKNDNHVPSLISLSLFQAIKSEPDLLALKEKDENIFNTLKSVYKTNKNTPILYMRKCFDQFSKEFEFFENVEKIANNPNIALNFFCTLSRDLNTRKKMEDEIKKLNSKQNSEPELESKPEFERRTRTQN